LKSNDKGKTWTSIASNLPSGTVYAIQEDHVDPNILFIGTEWGVWTTIDGGKHWAQLKNGLPTIQVKDLTIQERENDLVVATFGRGFYVLDDYSTLRSMSAEVGKSEAHLFDIHETLMYFPTNNLGYQGSVHFRAKNPTPEAKFEYFIKTGFESLKAKRKKAHKAAEKAGTVAPYPTEEELRLEKAEKKPQLVFTIYDKEGEIMRKLNAPFKKGYQTKTWDLQYLNNRGPSVPPGTYTVAIDKEMDGEMTRLIEPKPFVVKALDSALGTPAHDDNFNFVKDVNALNTNIIAARGKINDMNTRLKNLKTLLQRTPIEGNTLTPKIKAVEKEIEAVSKIILGGYGAKNSAASRTRFAMWATSGAMVNITGAQREQYQLAITSYDSQAAALEELHNTKVPTLESEFEAAGGVLYSNPPSRRRFEEGEKY